MRIDSQGIDVSLQQNSSSKVVSAKKSETNIQIQKNTTTEVSSDNVLGKADTIEGKEISKEKLQKAIGSINEFLEIDHKASKFVLHDGLNKYFVRIVDTDTDKVIKEIPPERLLDAFYEMQKLVGMIVDEKI